MLERHPDVAQAAVVPIDDEIKGQKPVAFVVAKPGRARKGGGHREIQRKSSVLCLCRKRAICPRSVAVCNRPPLEPASSKSCCIFVGIAVDCVSTSAPWCPSVCFPCCARMASPYQFSSAPGLLVFFEIGNHPLFVFGQREVALFELPKVAGFGRQARRFQQFRKFCRFRTILLGCGHEVLSR